HRRTYIGAMPGRIVQALRRAGAKNPVLLLDEVDKLGQNFRGDPAAALLEILDPAQNSTFRDNYVDLPFDLSQVMFITTANSLDSIPRPLLDRLEIIRLSGYSVDEKLDIAQRHLLPRQQAAAGLRDEQLEVTTPAVRAIASRYTREAGVRQLDRQFARLCRKVARRHADGQADAVRIDVDSLAEWLGPEKFAPEKARAELPPGVATGLAWTEAGGDVLYVEAARLPGGRRLTLTGQLGDVMRESARTAHSWVWSRATELGIPPRRFTDGGVHLHVPAGAIPKDGPSAGIALATALVSLLTNRPVRQDTAFTGELTLTGLVLPVGGIKEKVLAAHRAGLKRVILSKANEADLAELPASVRAEIEILLVEHVDEVLDAAIPGLRNPGVRRSACRAVSRKRRAAAPDRARGARSQK
ncbi:MAG TPA: AAA family ATPase, partial [Pirellulaceae bacterium]|nr:AAA family ATPase [Pirellulaceae bacterium]